MIEDFPDLNCDVEHSVLTKMEQQDIHKAVSYTHLDVYKRQGYNAYRKIKKK